MAHTKQTARKHHESPKKTNAVKKLPIKKNAGKKLSRANVTKSENDASDEGKKITSPSDRIATRVRISYDFDRDLGTHMLFIFIGQHFDITSLHTSLLPAETRAFLEEWLYQPNQQSPQRLYFFDELPVTLEVYRRYLYSETKALQSWHGDSDQDFVDDGDAEAHEDREWIRLAHAYLLELRLRDEEFCNVAVNGLVEKMTETDRYPTGLAADVYSKTSPGNRLRSLIVDLHIWKGLGTWISAPHNDASGPAACIQDVQTGLATTGAAIHDPDVPMPWEVDLCQYHTHAITSQCERHDRPIATTLPSEGTMYATSTEESQRTMADWFFRRSRGELVLDEDEVMDEIEVQHSPPKMPRSPRTAAKTYADKKQGKQRTPKRR